MEDKKLIRKEKINEDEYNYVYEELQPVETKIIVSIQDDIANVEKAEIKLKEIDEQITSLEEKKNKVQQFLAIETIEVEQEEEFPEE